MSAVREVSLPAERTGRPAPPDLVATRDRIAGAGAAGAWRTDPPAEALEIAGVRALRFRPEGPSAATILHFHGGGFRIGCPEMVGPFAARLARECGVTLVCPAYRLAPEHPFPAAIRDGLGVARALLETGETRLILSGDSAGGGVAAATAVLLAGEAVAVSGLVLLSPWLDLTVASGCYARNGASDPWFSGDAAREAADFYLQGAAADDPLASPLFADPGLFPPSFVSAGTGEVLAEDAQDFHDRLAVAGVPVALSLIPGMEHVAVTRDMRLDGAEATFEEVRAFINKTLSVR